MPPRDTGLIHVAGIIDASEAEMIIGCGVNFLGFPLVLGHHEEDLSTDAAAAIVATLGHRARFFLITYLDKACDIVALCHRLNVSMVQLHGAVNDDVLKEVRDAAPPLRIIKNLVVRSDNADELARDAVRTAPLVDAFITDTFDSETGATGATGKTHDWAVSRRLVVQSPKPVILAGGLTPSNVRAAIETVRPAGVDVHTGIEGADGRKRRDLVARFVAEARDAFG